MASIEQRIKALERIVDHVTHRLTWEDVAIMHFQVVGRPDLDYYWPVIQESDGTRVAIDIEKPALRALMIEHGYRNDDVHGEGSPLGLWRHKDQPEPVYEEPEPEGVSTYVQVPEDAPQPILSERIDDPAPHTEPPKPEKPKRMKWWEWMARVEDDEQMEDYIEDKD